MSTRRLQLGLFGLLIAASGCARNANALEGFTQPEAAPARVHASQPLTLRPVNDPTINLTNLGAEPRQVLSLKARPGTTQSIEVVQTGSGTFSVRDANGSDKTVADFQDNSRFTYPTITIQATLKVRSAHEEQRTVDVAVTSVSASNVADPIMTDQADRLAAGLANKTATILTTESGRVIGDEPVIGDGERSGSLVLGFLDRNVFTLADPLPSEPVGVGATWVISSPATSAGLPATVHRAYKIASIDNDYVRASVTRTITYASGEHLETFIHGGSTLTGTGEAVWARDGIVGVMSYDSAGSIVYDLGLGDTLRQVISRRVTSKINRLDFPPDPTTTTTPPTTAASPDVPAIEPEQATPGVETTTTTIAPAQPPARDVERPSEPGQPESEIDADNKGIVELTWKSATDNVGVLTYEVYRTRGRWTPTNAKQEAELVKAAELVDTTTEPTLTQTLKAGRYHYFVKAVDAAGNTSWRSGITEVKVR